jgi:uncharacterized protein YbjT (DUF2867 family)
VPTRNLAHGEQLRVLDTVELLVANIHDPGVLGQLFKDVDVVITSSASSTSGDGRPFVRSTQSLPRRSRTQRAGRASGDFST